MVRCKRYLYHLQVVFNLNTTFWDQNTLFDKKKYNFMKNSDISSFDGSRKHAIIEDFDEEYTAENPMISEPIFGR